MEVVLPGDPPAPLGGQPDRLVEERGQAGVVGPAGEEVAVGLAECAEPLDLEPLTGVVLPDELAPGEADPLPVGEQRAGRPPLAVALERDDEPGQARRREHPGGGDPVEVGQDGRELVPPRPAQAPERAPGVEQGRPVAVPGRLVDQLGGEQPVEGGGEGRRRPARGPGRPGAAGRRRPPEVGERVLGAEPVDVARDHAVVEHEHDDLVGRPRGYGSGGRGRRGGPEAAQRHGGEPGGGPAHRSDGRGPGPASMQVPLHVAEDCPPPLARPGAAAGGTRSPTPARARRRRSDRGRLGLF